MVTRRQVSPILITLTLALLGLAPPAFAAIWYQDLDNDGYGNPSVTLEAPSKPPGYVSISGDCNDADPSIHPGAIELCNGVDDDCDGEVDENAIDANVWFVDADADGFGSPVASVLACTQPTGFVADDSDCDDTDPSIHPGAIELCNGVDDDCDGEVDENAIDANVWFVDADADGFGSPVASVLACTQPTGFVADDSDCDDTDPSIHPGAIELCNGLDDDCDGEADEGAVDAPTWFVDADADGFGDPTAAVLACVPPTGTVADGSDCDDTNAAVHPGANETCNGIDDDCDGEVDENGVDATTWFVDADADGFGDPTAAVLACVPPTGTVADGSDCDDTNAAVHPGTNETCNGIDDDCDGEVDEGGVCTPFEILAVADVGNDQGRRVRLQWNPQQNDRSGMPVTILSYSIYRRVEAGLAPGVVDATPPGTWDFVMNLPASGESIYSTVVSTLCDSTTNGICWSTFFVRAHTPAPLTYYDTAPAQGYSVDNLAPAAPQGLVVTFNVSGNVLAWDGDAEPDLAYWRIYRSTEPGFVPSAATLVHSTASPGWTDAPSGTAWFYKVTAIDFAGNEGPAASLQGTVDAGEATVSGFGLAGAAPNPSSGNSIVSFSVPASGGKIALNVYDPGGRLVGTLARGFHAAGVHRVQWSGRDGGGRLLPAGTYYLRLQTPTGTFARRVTLLR